MSLTFWSLFRLVRDSRPARRSVLDVLVEPGQHLVDHVLRRLHGPIAVGFERQHNQARRAAGLVSSGITQMDELVEIVLAISQNSAQIRRIKEASEARYEPGTIDCIDLGLIPADLPFGQISPIAGDAEVPDEFGADATVRSLGSHAPLR